LLAAVRSGLFRCAGEGDRAGEVGHRSLDERRPSGRGGPAGPGDKGGYGEHRGAGEGCRADPTEGRGRHQWSMSTFEGVVGEGFCPVAVGPPRAQREPARAGLRPGRAGSSRVRRRESRHGGQCLWSLHVAARSVVPARGFARGRKRSSSSARRFSRSPTSTSDSPRLSVGQRATGAPGAGARGPRPRDYARSSGRGMERPPRSALLTQT